MPADMKPNLASARRLADDHQPARTVALRTIQDATSHQLPSNGIGAQVIKNPDLAVNLTAALVAISNDTPVVLTALASGIDALPSARYQSVSQLTLDGCLRQGVAEQTGFVLGHAEQLQTFAERSNGLAVGYLALTRTGQGTAANAAWRSWYDYLPWEDWREGTPALLAATIEPRLRNWVAQSADTIDARSGLARADRARLAFGFDRVPWNEERVADRFELLCEAGLIGSPELPSRPMRLEHLRVLGSAIGRLRTRLKVRPLVFELMEDEFTLFELQKTVEAILGPHLHKQNFRRLVESAGLVEPTGEVRSKTGGRPAKLFRFRREVLMERPAPGFRVHAQRM